MDQNQQIKHDKKQQYDCTVGFFYFFLNWNAHFMTGTLFFSRRLDIIGDQAIN